MKVMIVDDSESIRAMIRGMLSDSVESFCECSDGSEALATYTQFHPDWVLMDIKMKKTDGFEATKQILSSFPDAKVIMVTQYDEPKLHEKAIFAGAKEFVLKENLIDIEKIIQAKQN